jgi:hypothetical protein
MNNVMQQQIYQGQPSHHIITDSPGTAFARAREPSFSSGISLIQLKRKKIKELLLAGGGPLNRGTNNTSNINALEREELQQQKRTLKLQMNIMKDENMRMKTKMSFI